MKGDKKIYTVLIVDDMSINIQILVGFLKSDYHVKIATNGKKTLEIALSKNPPDLILMDIVMPEMDGFETCRRLKADEKTREIPVIFITVLANIEDKIKGFEAGGADYVTKPFQREEVLARVRTHLKIQRQNKQLQQQALELENARNIAEEANRAKSIFLANMSHEIRTPMNAILGFSELLMGKIENPHQKNYLTSIYSSGKSLLSLINDILDLSKIEAGRLEIQPEPVSIKGMLSEVNLVFLHKLQEKGVKYKSDISSQLPDGLLIDEIRMRQILINLVGNAIKFTSCGHVKISVFCAQNTPSQASDRLDVIFEVEDTGIGIPQDQVEVIFENFRQQDGQQTRKYGGTGLGLAITKRLVEMMNGKISVKSEVGKGSIFQVFLSDVQVVEESDIAENSRESDEINIEFEPATILLVDDIDYNRELVKGYLEDTPLSITEAEDGEKALAMLRKTQTQDSQSIAQSGNRTSFGSLPDLILMDLKMPGKSGYDITEIIKNDNELKRMPVIAVSASAMKETEDRLKHLCDGYIKKPFGKAELLSELKRHLPHTVVRQTESASEATNKETLSPESIAQLPELIQILESEFVPKWEDIRETLIFDEVGDFAEQINEKGNKYGCMHLTDWSETVTHQIQSFDMGALLDTFEKFPEIIKKLKGLKIED